MAISQEKNLIDLKHPGEKVLIKGLTINTFYFTNKKFIKFKVTGLKETFCVDIDDEFKVDQTLEGVIAEGTVTDIKTNERFNDLFEYLKIDKKELHRIIQFLTSYVIFKGVKNDNII